MPSVIPPGFTRRISHANLQRFVQHCFGGTSMPTTWSELADWCYLTVTRADPPVPPSIRAIFEGLHVLSTEAGAKLLLEVASSQGVDLVAQFGYMSIEDRAVVAYLEHPAVFFLAVSRAREIQVPEGAFLVFAGPAQSRTSLADLSRRTTQLEGMLTFWQQTEGRPGRPRIRFKDHNAFLTMEVLTSGLPTSRVGLEGETVPSSAFQDAVILVDPKQRFVAIRADDDGDVEFYRELAGVAVVGNPSAFYKAPIVTAPSLITRGVLEELEVTVPGLASVRLHHAELGLKQQGSVYMGRAALLTEASSAEFASMLSGTSKLTLELRLAESGPAYAVHVAPPNELRFNHLVVGAQALQLLQSLQLLRV